MGKSDDFRADMAGLGKYSTGGYDRIGVQLHGFEHLRTKMDAGMAPCTEGAPISPKQSEWKTIS